MSGNNPTIHFRVTQETKEGIDKIAKEYNLSISAMMRVLVADVLDEEIDEGAEFRSYARRKEKESGK